MPSSRGSVSPVRAYSGILFCVVVWAVNYPAMKIALRELAPLAYTGWRFALAAGILVVWALVRRSPIFPSRAELPFALLLALTGVVVYQWFFALGVGATSGFSAALLNGVSPLLAVLLVTLLGWERLTPYAAAGSVLAYVGVGLFLWSAHGGSDLGSLAGNLLCLGSAACWAVYCVITSRAEGRIEPFTAHVSMFVLGAPAVLAYCLPSMLAQDYAAVSAAAWIICALSAVLPLVVAFHLWNIGIRVLGVARTTRLAFLIPVLAGVASAVWTGERFTATKLASAALVLLGLALTRFGRAWKLALVAAPE